MGKLTESNGDVYEGRFVNGKLQGKGTLRYENDAIYVGEFVDCKPRGKGNLTFLNGAIDEGEFVGSNLTSQNAPSLVKIGRKFKFYFYN